MGTQTVFCCRLLRGLLCDQSPSEARLVDHLGEGLGESGFLRNTVFGAISYCCGCQKETDKTAKLIFFIIQ